MAVKRNIYRSGLNLTVFIILEIVASGMLGRSSKGQDFFLSKLSHSFTGAIWGSSQSIGNYFGLKGINEQLSKENFSLRAALMQAGLDADSLALMDGKTETVGNYRYTWASVVKMSRNKHHNYLIVNKGAEDGVQAHTGIITDKGVVGIIDTVGAHYSYAISLLNNSFNISARIGRDGAVGPMVWNGRNTHGAILKEISLQYRFRQGDTVFTSGYSSIFPPDIPLGTIGDSRIINGSTYDIDINLFQDFSSIRYVTLVTNTEREEITEIEKKEASK